MCPQLITSPFRSVVKRSNVGAEVGNAAANAVSSVGWKDVVWKNLTRRNLMYATLAAIAAPMAYRLVQKAYEPPVGVDSSELLKKYYDFLKTVDAEYPALNPILGGLVGAGLGAAYAKFQDKDAIPPVLLGTLLGGGLGYIVGK